MDAHIEGCGRCLSCRNGFPWMCLERRQARKPILRTVPDDDGVLPAFGNACNECGQTVVRYADDFVVFCETQEDAVECIRILREWLAQRGLQLSEEKTRIVHLQDGFDFLGFNIRHYRDRRTVSGWKLLITPSRKSVEKIKEKLRTLWRRGRHWSVDILLHQLNPVVRGWANYFRTHVATDTFNDLDRWMFHRQVRHVKRLHKGKNWEWLRSRYWSCKHPTRRDRWVFGSRVTGRYLVKFRWVRIRRHAMVKGAASPDNPVLRDYWVWRRTLTARSGVAPFLDMPLCTFGFWHDEAGL